MPTLRLELEPKAARTAQIQPLAVSDDRMSARVELRAISDDDLPAVASFLHVNLNRRLSAAAWLAALKPGWQARAPNHGFMLLAGGTIVGAQIAYYAERVVGGCIEKLCNVSALCVAEGYRAHSLRLVTAILRQKGYTFTDLSPSGNVVALNDRLNFRHLDTATTLVFNWPWFRRDVRIVETQEAIEELLDAVSLAIYRDHAACRAARHAVVVVNEEPCYVIFRRDRRKRLPLFVSILFVSRPDIFRHAARHFCSHLLVRYGVPATLLEERVVGFRPMGGLRLGRPRPKMFRSDHLLPEQIDYLYSELACIPS